MPAAAAGRDDARMSVRGRPCRGRTTTREAFLRLLRGGPDGGDALETLDRIGLLERFLPAWASGAVPAAARPLPPVLGRRAPAGERSPARGGCWTTPGTTPSRGRGGRGRSTDADALLLGALLHDIGKIGEGAPRRGRRSQVARADARARGGRRRRRPTSPCSWSRSTCCCRTPRPGADLDDEDLVRRTSPRQVGDHGSAGGAVPAGDRGRGGHGAARVDAVARDAGPRAGRQGPARPRAGRDRGRSTAARLRAGGARSARVLERREPPRRSSASLPGCRAATC